MSTGLSVGVDIGGTKIALACVDKEGAITHKAVIKTHIELGFEGIAQEIVKGVKSLQEQRGSAIDVVGVGAAGQVDSKQGIVLSGGNLHWINAPLGATLKKGIGIPVFVLNDVRAASWGEWLFGAGRGCQDLLCIFVGTGIGGGIISHGQLLTGYNNSAGEIGHILVEMQGRPCTCGGHGCLEAWAGGWAIAKRAREAGAAAKRVRELAGGDVEKIAASHVIQAYRQEDPLAKEIVQEAIDALVAGTISLVNALSPQRVILSGGVIDNAPELVDPIREGVFKGCLPTARRGLEIVPGALKQDAGVIGAAAWAGAQLKR